MESDRLPVSVRVRSPDSIGSAGLAAAVRRRSLGAERRGASRGDSEFQVHLMRLFFFLAVVQSVRQK
jgi:hypothetical protein